MPASRIAALGLSLLLAGGVAACGGDDDGGDGGGGASGESVSAEAYAADVCGAMQEWLSGIQERTESLGEGLQTGDAAEGKRVLADLLTEMSAETGELITAVEEAGVPDVDGGEEAADSLVSAFEEVQDILDNAQDDIAALSEDPQEFQQGAAELGPTLQQALSGVGESLEEPESEDLKNAFENEESCSSIP